MPTSTYTPIATTTLTSNTASYTFSSIPATYTDLVLVMNYAGCTSAGAAANVGGLLQLNSDTTTSYSQSVLYGFGSSASSGRETTQASYFINDFGYMASTASLFGTAVINIMNYANTTTYKTFLESSANIDNTQSASMGVNRSVGLWRNTAAITTIKLYVNSTNLYRTGSTFTLYGIKAA